MRPGLHNKYINILAKKKNGPVIWAEALSRTHGNNKALHIVNSVLKLIKNNSIVDKTTVEFYKIALNYLTKD